MVNRYCVPLLIILFFFTPADSIGKKKNVKDEPEILLQEIYKEVKELGEREKESFIKREFNLDLDKNPKNAEEHIVVLIYDTGGSEKMVLQLTYFVSKGLNQYIKYAKDIQLITCVIKSDKLEIEKNDFNKKGFKNLLNDILQGIKEEKKLFKLIDQ